MVKYIKELYDSLNEKEFVKNKYLTNRFDDFGL